MLANRRSKRKPTGGYRASIRARDRKLSELANPAVETQVISASAKDSKEVRKVYRGKGANEKVKIYKTKFANINLGGKNVVAQVLSVKQNQANIDYVRRNVVTRGAIIRVSFDGKEYEAKVTSRPGQSGIVSAVKI